MKIISLSASLAVALSVASSLSAATVSVNLGQDDFPISGTELVGVPAVAEAASAWTNLQYPDTVTSGTYTGSITVGGVTISFSSNYIGDAANGTSDQNHTMMNGMMAMNNAGGTFVTVTGLGTDFTSAGYDVYVYVGSDTTRTHDLAGSDNASNTDAVVSASTDDGQFLSDGGNYETTPSYIVLSGFTGSDFTLTRGSGSGGVPQITGIQVVSVPEPSSSFALVGLGCLGLILRRRK